MNFLSQVTENPESIEESLSGLSKFGKGLLDGLISFVEKYWGTALAVVIVYFVGRKLIKLLLKFLTKTFEKSSMEEGPSGFLLALIKVTLNIVLIIVVAGILGIQTSSFVALLGSAGLTLGLALQGSLSNFAGGVLILITRPFKVGDYIVAQTNEGTVTKIDIFYTHITTVDNQLIVMPNGALSNMDLKNVTNETTRRLDLIIPVPYSSNTKRVREILLNVCRRNEMILQDEPMDIFLYEFASSAVNMSIRVWVNTENYWPVKWELQEAIKEALDEAGIAIPFNQLDVTIVKEQQ